jgi:hypothetical protein
MVLGGAGRDWGGLKFYSVFAKNVSVCAENVSVFAENVSVFAENVNNAKTKPLEVYELAGKK